MTEETKSLNLLFMMLDNRLKSIVKPHFEILRSKYKNSELIKQLLKFYDSKDNNTKADVEQLLDICEIQGQARNELLESYNSVSELSLAGLETIRTKFKKLIAKLVLDKVRGTDDPAEAVRIIQQYNYNFEDSNVISKKISNYELGSINPEEVIEEFGTPIKSSVDAINDCFTTGGYIPHQLICVVAPPSCGKSLFLTNEAIRMLMDGHRVCYIAIGDLTKYDFMVRTAALGTGATMNEVAKDLKRYWNGFKSKMGATLDNFGVYYIDANEISSKELLKYINDYNLIEKYNIFIVDYDTNFRSDNDMYLKGDEIYNDLANLSKKVDLVFVASQPKTGAFDQELILMNDAAESGRKPQIVDVMITISKNQHAVGTQIGMINLAKVRRNGKSTHFPYMLNLNGKFIPIAMNHYKALEKDTESKYAPGKGMVQDFDIQELTEIIKK